MLPSCHLRLTPDLRAASNQFRRPRRGETRPSSRHWLYLVRRSRSANPQPRQIRLSYPRSHETARQPNLCPDDRVRSQLAPASRHALPIRLWLRPIPPVRHSRASRFSQAALETECDHARAAASDSRSCRQERVRVQGRQFCECLLARRTVRPSETALSLRKKGGECIRAQNLGFQTHPCNPHQVLACECCCRSQTSPLLRVAAQALLLRAGPSIGSSAQRK